MSLNRLYVDGSHDARTGKGAYCIVIVALGKKDWFVEDCDTPYVEEEGLNEAIILAARLAKKTGKPTKVYSDSVSAIKANSRHAAELGIELCWIRGHLLGNDDIPVEPNIKAHHWADRMAYGRVVDRLKTEAYNQRRKEPQNAR